MPMASLQKSAMRHTSMTKKLFHALTTSTVLLWSTSCSLSTLVQQTSAKMLVLKTPDEEQHRGDEKSGNVAKSVEHFVPVTERGQEVWDSRDGKLEKIGENFYWVLKTPFGQGSYGKNKVYKAVRAVNKTPGNKDEFQPAGDIVVVKVMPYDEDVQTEIDILEKLDHPNIVKIFDHQIEYTDEKNDTAESEKKACLVMEMAGDQELFDLVVDEDGRPRYLFSMDEIRDILLQIFRAVAYLHAQGIAHRDIKLENVMVSGKIAEVGAQGKGIVQPSTQDSSSSSSGTRRKLSVKLIDFGISTRVGDGALNSSNDNTGTLEYAAPENLKKTADEMKFSLCPRLSDMWSCGVLAFTMFAGRMPFYPTSDDENEPELARKIQKGVFSFPTSRKPGRAEIPDEAKNLIQALLQVDPQNRPTASDALHHEFFTGSNESESERQTGSWWGQSSSYLASLKKLTAAAGCPRRASTLALKTACPSRAPCLKKVKVDKHDYDQLSQLP